MTDPAAGTQGHNVEQNRYWNEIGGPTWARLHRQIDSQLQAFGLAAMDRAGVVSGAHVLDVGCGAGATSMELGRRVGPSGRVTGVDLSGPLLDVAREAVGSAGLSNVTFVRADASQTSLPEASFDLLFSRFGVMFFEDPAAAFAHLRERLRPGGELVFACWRGPEHNPWVVVPLAAVAQHLPITPPDPEAPGPFAFANDARVRGILEAAGFVDVGFEAYDHAMTIGGAPTLDEAVEFLVQVGPAARALREADPAIAPAVKAALRDAVRPFFGPEGLTMGGSVWIVTARRA